MIFQTVPKSNQERTGVLSNIFGLVLRWRAEVYFTALRRNVRTRTVDPVEQTAVLGVPRQFEVLVLSCRVRRYGLHGFHPMARFEGGPELLHVKERTTRLATISIAQYWYDGPSGLVCVV